MMKSSSRIFFQLNWNVGPTRVSHIILICIDRFQPTSVYIDSIDPKFFFRGNNLAWNVNIIYYITCHDIYTANEYIWNWDEDVPCQLLDLFLVWFKVSGILGSRLISEYSLHEKVSFTDTTSL